MKATLTRAIGGLFFVFFILTMFSLEAGFAAEKEDKPVISITPRLWYTNMNINEYNPSTTYQETWKHLNIPIYGVTFGFAPKSLKSTEFLLTVLHGTGNTQGTVVNANGNTTPATVDLKRHDL